MARVPTTAVEARAPPAPMSHTPIFAMTSHPLVRIEPTGTETANQTHCAGRQATDHASPRRALGHEEDAPRPIPEPAEPRPVEEVASRLRKQEGEKEGAWGPVR